MTNFNKCAVQCLVAGLTVGAITAPSTAHAQSVTHWVNRQLHVDDHSRHGHSTGRAWQGLAYVGAGVAVVGILTHSPALIGLGIVGGLYSLWRFDQDRHSHNAHDRRRYAYFSQKHRVIDGHHYHRVTVTSEGHKYYAYRRD